MALAALAAYGLWSVPDLGTSLVPAIPSTVSPSVEPVAQAVASRLGAPGAPGGLVSSVIPRLFLAVGSGSSVERLGLMAVLAGALSVFLVVRINDRLELDGLPAVVGAAVVAGGGSVLSLVASGGADTLALPLILGLLLSGACWAQTRRPVALATLVGLTAATVGSYPVSLAVVLSIVGLQADLLWRGRAGWHPLLLTVSGAMFGLAHRAGAAALIAAEVSTRLAPDAASDVARSLGWSTLVGLGGRPPGDVQNAIGVMGALVTDEVGLLGGLIVGLGVVEMVRRRGLGWLTCAAAVLTAVWIAVSISLNPVADQAVLMVLVWLPAGAGLQWALSSSETRPARLGVAVLGVLLVASNLVRHEGRVPWFVAQARTEHAERLLATTSGAAWVVAEHRTLDRALVLPADHRRGGVQPQNAEVARRAYGDGERLLAFEQGRQHLERFGVQFEPVPLPATQVPLRQYLESLPGRSVVALAAGAGFSRMIDPGTESLFGVVGGTGPRFGDRGAYAVVGVTRGGGVAVERAAGDRVVLDVEAGDPIGTHVMRSSVNIHVVSDEQGAWVEVDGERLAGTRTGLALVALTAAGQVLASFGVEAEGEMRVPLPRAGPRLWRMIGVEPCVSLPANRWVDVVAATAAGAVARVTPTDSSGTIELYLGAAVSLRPEGVAPEDTAPPAPVGTRYLPISATDRARLVETLERDGASFGPRLMESAVVERLQLVDGVVGVSLRGAPERGFARYTPGVAGAGRAELCGSVWGNARLATEDGQSDIPIQELDRLGWGWHGVERDLNGDFRWSDGPVAEVLLQLTRIGAIRVELDASAAAVGLIDGPVAVTLEVNGDEMSPLEMVGAAQTYAWRVPRSSWKTGMNQVRFRVSDAVSPAAFGPSDDRRTLGLGVRRLELTLLE